MAKLAFYTFLLVSLWSCNKKTDASNVKDNTEQSIPADTILVGNDSDAFGCKSSAGYTWSVLQQNCVRLFEIATRLNPYENPVKDESSAFVLFDGDKAELFLPSLKKSMLLVRNSEGEPFINGDYQLIPWKGYVLKKSGTILFIGQ